MYAFGLCGTKIVHNEVHQFPEPCDDQSIYSALDAEHGWFLNLAVRSVLVEAYLGVEKGS